MCKSFRVSSIIDSGYRFILLLYHYDFGSNSQTVPRKYPHGIDLHKDDVFLSTMSKFAYKTMQNDYDVVIFFSHPEQKVDLH